MSPFAKSNWQVLPGVERHFSKNKTMCLKKKSPCQNQPVHNVLKLGSNKLSGNLKKKNFFNTLILILKILFWNVSWCQMTGDGHDLELGQHWEKFTTRVSNAACLESELFCNLSKLKKVRFPQFDQLLPNHWPDSSHNSIVLPEKYLKEW